ncbi:signal peptidase II [Candidatus Peregrinibacteria bacterium]|nr:signal peptidase II [Candidatus Peregrinibacteria bacterium]
MPLFLIGALGWLLLDLIAKRWAVSDAFISFHWVDSWFYLTLTSNSGIAFGIALPRIIQIIGSIAVIIVLTIGFIKSNWKQRPFNQLIAGIVLGGAMGNWIERLVNGSVIDFIYLWPFPVFNIADIGITLGLIILVVYNFNKRSS